MPYTRIAMRAGKPPEFRAAIVRELYKAMREAFDVPEDDIFVTFTQHQADEFYYSRSYAGIERDDDLLMIQVTANNTRTLERKKEFFARLAAGLEAGAGVESRNVFVNITECDKENWSLGLGLAQYAAPARHAV